LTLTRPCYSGSLTLVTSPTTTWEAHSPYCGGWTRSSRPRAERPLISKFV
jgi:hypothetical protein